MSFLEINVGICSYYFFWLIIEYEYFIIILLYDIYIFICMYRISLYIVFIPVYVYDVYAYECASPTPYEKWHRISYLAVIV